MRPKHKSTADSRSVQSLKTLDTGILLLAVFTLELETDYPSETSLCTVGPFATDTHSPIFFLREGGDSTQAIWNG